MRRKFAVCMAAALLVLTACGRVEKPDSAGNPGNYESLEGEKQPVSDEVSPENNLAGNESAAIAGTALPEGLSVELPQPYARYMEVLEQIKREGHDSNGREYHWDESWNFENNCFAIKDIDNDGKQELLFNFNESYMGAMCEVVYEYDEETDILHEELATWVSTDYYSNGLVKVQMSHNHGKDPVGRGVWPYMVYQYDADEDCYQLIYTVDSWDGQVNEEDFPDELDLNGDKLLYYVSVEHTDTVGRAPEDTDGNIAGNVSGNTFVDNDGIMIFDWEEYNAWTEALMPEWNRINVVYHRMEEDFIENVKDAYAQAAAYAAQADVWFVGEEAGSVASDYLLYDLDSDGSLELITSVNQGTGRYSDNHFYSLEDNGMVTELELIRMWDSKEREWNADFDIGGTTRILAYQDSDGTIYYEGNDYTRDGIYGGYDETGFYYLKDGIVYQDSIRRRTQFFHKEDGQEDEVYYYEMETTADGEFMEEKEITEEQYEAIREGYIDGMTEISVYQNWVYFRWDEITQGNPSEEAIRLKLFESFLGSR